MSLRLTLKLWIKYRKEHLKRVEENEALGIINYESSDDDEKIAAPTGFKKGIKTMHQRPEITIAQIAPSEWILQKPPTIKRVSTKTIVNKPENK